MANAKETTEFKKILPYINAENETSDSVVRRAVDYERNGADGLFIYNYTVTEAENEEFLHTVKLIVRQVDVPVYIGVRAKRFEDIKKAFYTGATQVVVPYAKISDFAILKEGSDRFGKDKLVVELDAGTLQNTASLQID